jgi:hypothetical protein
LRSDSNSKFWSILIDGKLASHEQIIFIQNDVMLLSCDFILHLKRLVSIKQFSNLCLQPLNSLGQIPDHSTDIRQMKL